MFTFALKEVLRPENGTTLSGHVNQVLSRPNAIAARLKSIIN